MKSDGKMEHVVQVRRGTVSKSSSCLICRITVKNIFCLLVLHGGGCLGQIDPDAVIRLHSFPALSQRQVCATPNL